MKEINDVPLWARLNNPHASLKLSKEELTEAEKRVNEINELIKRDNYDPMKHFIVSCLISTVALLVSVIALIVSICEK